MSTLAWIAMAVAVLAIIGLGFRLPDAWFCLLLALACLLGGAETAYYDRQPWPVLLLTAGAMFAGASVHAALRDRRRT